MTTGSRPGRGPRRPKIGRDAPSPGTAEGRVSRWSHGKASGPERRPGGVPGAKPSLALRGELLSGLHSVREALRAGRRPLYQLLLARGIDPAIRLELEDLARSRHIPVLEVDRTDLRLELDAERAYGMGLDVGALPTTSVTALASTGVRGRRLIVALDGVEDPQNLGAIVRVVDAAGAGGVILTERRAAPTSPAVSRASAGAIEHVPVARVTNLLRALEEFKSLGFWTIGLDAADGDDLFALPNRILSGDLVVVLGAEGRGLRRGLSRALDHRVRIPMQGRVGSLNVATAAAIALFELRRRADLSVAPADER